MSFETIQSCLMPFIQDAAVLPITDFTTESLNTSHEQTHESIFLWIIRQPQGVAFFINNSGLMNCIDETCLTSLQQSELYYQLIKQEKGRLFLTLIRPAVLEKINLTELLTTLQNQCNSSNTQINSPYEFLLEKYYAWLIYLAVLQNKFEVLSTIKSKLDNQLVIDMVCYKPNYFQAINYILQKPDAYKPEMLDEVLSIASMGSDDMQIDLHAQMKEITPPSHFGYDWSGSVIDNSLEQIKIIEQCLMNFRNAFSLYEIFASYMVATEQRLEGVIQDTTTLLNSRGSVSPSAKSDIVKSLKISVCNDINENFITREGLSNFFEKFLLDLGGINELVSENNTVLLLQFIKECIITQVLTSCANNDVHISNYVSEVFSKGNLQALANIRTTLHLVFWSIEQLDQLCCFTEIRDKHELIMNVIMNKLKKLHNENQVLSNDIVMKHLDFRWIFQNVSLISPAASKHHQLYYAYVNLFNNLAHHLICYNCKDNENRFFNEMLSNAVYNLDDYSMGVLKFFFRWYKEKNKQIYYSTTTDKLANYLLENTFRTINNKSYKNSLEILILISSGTPDVLGVFYLNAIQLAFESNPQYKTESPDVLLNRLFHLYRKNKQVLIATCTKPNFINVLLKIVVHSRESQQAKNVLSVLENILFIHEECINAVCTHSSFENTLKTYLFGETEQDNMNVEFLMNFSTSSSKTHTVICTSNHFYSWLDKAKLNFALFSKLLTYTLQNTDANESEKIKNKITITLKNIIFNNPHLPENILQLCFHYNLPQLLSIHNEMEFIAMLRNFGSAGKKVSKEIKHKQHVVVQNLLIFPLQKTEQEQIIIAEGIIMLDKIINACLKKNWKMLQKSLTESLDSTKPAVNSIQNMTKIITNSDIPSYCSSSAKKYSYLWELISIWIDEAQSPSKTKMLNFMCAFYILSKEKMLDLPLLNILLDYLKASRGFECNTLHQIFITPLKDMFCRNNVHELDVFLTMLTYMKGVGDLLIEEKDCLVAMVDFKQCNKERMQLLFQRAAVFAECDEEKLDKALVVIKKLNGGADDFHILEDDLLRQTTNNLSLILYRRKNNFSLRDFACMEDEENIKALIAIACMVLPSIQYDNTRLDFVFEDLLDQHRALFEELILIGNDLNENNINTSAVYALVQQKQSIKKDSALDNCIEERNFLKRHLIKHRSAVVSNEFSKIYLSSIRLFFAPSAPERIAYNLSNILHGEKIVYQNNILNKSSKWAPELYNYLKQQGFTDKWATWIVVAQCDSASNGAIFNTRFGAAISDIRNSKQPAQKQEAESVEPSAKRMKM